MRSFIVSFKYRDHDSRIPTRAEPRINTASDLRDLLGEIFETELADGRLTDLDVSFDHERMFAEEEERARRDDAARPNAETNLW